MNTNAFLVFTIISQIGFTSANPESNPSLLHKLIKRAAVMTRKCEEFEEEPITKRWKCIKVSSVKPITQANLNLHEFTEEATVTSKSSFKTSNPIITETEDSKEQTGLEQEYELIIEGEASKDIKKTWLEEEYELIVEGLILEGLTCISKSSEDFEKLVERASAILKNSSKTDFVEIATTEDSNKKSSTWLMQEYELIIEGLILEVLTCTSKSFLNTELNTAELLEVVTLIEMKSSQGSKSRRKTRNCEEFKQEPITKRWKCIKYSTSKPVANEKSDINDTPSKLEKLINRFSYISNSSSKTGYAGITATRDPKDRRKTRECEDFQQEPITKKWKCIKFLVVSQKNPK